MGLDIYVGTLTRYYAGDWQTIVRQSAEGMGMEVQVVRPSVPADVVTDPAEIRSAPAPGRARGASRAPAPANGD